ncbi:Zn-dependent protease with chaperone function [Kitasatospora sp. MAP12-15]|uniref:M48 family metallopeptidase n=1 Tax=unclassified Kitasatospora TaxID=2633591 RepID=UPI0024755493|nr:M48 family metallopeptidase [Kitasatospora sp. MAP12-44]MDH6108323.1 Zn-dependent protease with chaperone function [Kitasatospora sp. MAP12-44]
MARMRALAGLVILFSWYLSSVVVAYGLLWFGLFCLRNVRVALDTGLYMFVFYAAPAALSIAALIVGNVVRSVLPLAPVREDSLPLSRAEAPALWRMVDESAERIGARPPAQVRLIMDANAAAVERTALLGLLGGERLLYVGVPLMIMLDADELRAVLAHELGHDAARHTRFSALTIRASHALDVTLRQARADLRTTGMLRRCQRIALGPLLLFAAVYHHTVLPARREHEFAADRAAVKVVGTEVMLRALHAYHAANRAWHDFSLRLLHPSLAMGVIPDDPFAAFAAVVDQPHYRQGLHAFREAPLPFARKDGPNPHPSLTERAERLRRGEPTDAPSGSEPTPKPLDDALELASLLARTPWARAEALPAAGCLRTTPWPQWLSSVGESASARQVDRLLRAVSRVAPAEQILAGVPPSLVLQSVGSRRQQLVQREAALGRRMAPREGERWLAEATAALIQRLLVADGQATWRVEWGAAVVADCPALERGELDALVSAVLAAQRGGTELRHRLEDLGLDLDTALTPTGPVSSAQDRWNVQEERTPWSVKAARTVGALALVLLLIASSAHLFAG